MGKQRKRKGQELTLKRNERRPVRVRGVVVAYVVCLRTGREADRVRLLIQEARK